MKETAATMHEGWVPSANLDWHQADSLAGELGVPAAIARLLVARGYATQQNAEFFLNPCMAQLHDPGLMLGMGTAVERMVLALQGSEKILIYGDYDVDGTVATVLLKAALERAAGLLGVAPQVSYHIPHRIREGYGMQDDRIALAAAEGVRLVVSVDTGIRAFAAAEQARRYGLDLIVTDHHLPDAQGVPSAVAVLNPNQPGCGYPYKGLCGAGVAFKLAQGMLERVTPDSGRAVLREKVLPSFLKLLAIATIADAVPLTGENRALAAMGLAELRRPAQAGLRALMELAAIDLRRPVGASDIGFRLAPRINAAGRMDMASDVVELFLCRDAVQARSLAEKLHRLNDDRRATEAAALRVILEQLKALSEEAESAGASLPGCLVLDDSGAEDGWHRGVIGILASRVVDQTGLPTLVIAHEDGVAYGSGRSVSGFHLLDALSAVHGEGSPGLLTRFGGHAHAVGFALPSASVATLRERMEKYAARAGSVAGSAVTLEYDCALRLGEISPEFLHSLPLLGPFGTGNAEPLLVSEAVRLASPVRVVKERHLRVALEDADDGARMDGMAWARRTNWAEKARDEGWQQGDRFDVAYRLRENLHSEFGGWELEIAAMERAEAVTSGRGPGVKP